MPQKPKPRIRFDRYALSLSLTLLTCGCGVAAALKQPIPASPPLGLNDRRVQRIGHTIRDTMRDCGIPGVSIAVVDGGKIVWAQGFGWRNVSDRLQVDPDTQFQAGSISKPVTALAVLLLSAQGKVDLDKDVNGYLKGWRVPSKYPDDPITLRQLLCHRAGMMPQGFWGYSESDRRIPSLQQILDDQNPLPGWFTCNYFGPVKGVDRPGSRYHYSGGGYCIVQKVIEDVTDLPFEVAMHRLVLQPLGMTRSHFHQPPPSQQEQLGTTTNISQGYGPFRGIVFRGRWRVFPQRAPAGLWSTPSDLARLILAVQAAQSGTTTGPITQAIAEQFLHPQFDGWMGMGVFLDGEGDERGFWHAGETWGYFARFGAGVSNGHGWVIMNNAQKDCWQPILKAIARESALCPACGYDVRATPARCPECGAAPAAR